MKLKIKTEPGDFIVEELADLPLEKRRRPYAVYLLKKRNWNTVDLLLNLSKKLNIPFKDLSYGGKKDRYGLTSQYITIRERPYLNLETENYSLKFIGFMLDPMTAHFIRGNHFKITVRNLSPADLKKASEGIRQTAVYGYPNYFDDQRFGSYDAVQGFLGEKVIRKHYNGALKIYLTAVH
ncbi:MAG: tRNA pseudouridine(13) synthase TruD, partial [bacterium]|nr:tRNA pseudouridine(13) synthase TruD [bacterium]